MIARTRSWLSATVVTVAVLLSAVFSRPALGQCGPTWLGNEWTTQDLAISTNSSFYSGVLASTMWDPDGAGPLPPQLVVGGGRLTAAGGRSVIGPLVWSNGSWTQLGSGLQGTVLCLAVLSDGTLVAGGTFLKAGGVVVNGVARWTGSAWAPFGTGVARDPMGGNASVFAVLPQANGEMIIGGIFSSAGGVEAKSIARWSGSSWSEVGGGFQTYVGGSPPVVSALAQAPNGDIYAGGNFRVAGNVFSPNIARWTGSAWASVINTALNSDLVNISSLAYLPDGRLAVGAVALLSIGEIGSVWLLTESDSYPILDTMGGVYSLAVSGSGTLVAAGPFTDPVVGVASWNGTTWTSLGNLNSYGAHLRFLPSGTLLVGGGFTSAGGIASTAVALWDGAWHAFTSAINGTVRTLAVDGTGNIIAAGQFNESPTLTSLGNIGRWNGRGWASLGAGVNGQVNASLLLPNGTLVVGGSFSQAGGSPASYVASWNGASWSALGSGLANGGGSGVAELLRLPNGDIIAGGGFLQTGSGATATRVARWNNSSWQTLGSGLGRVSGAGLQNDVVRALAVLPNGDIVAGGSFTQTGAGAAVNNIAKWNGSGWSALGSGVTAGGGSGRVDVLLTLANGDLIVGGLFDTAGGIPVSNVARWTGSAWQPFGGLPGQVRSLVLLPGGDILATGQFVLHRWTGTQWTEVGSPNGTVYAAAVRPNGDVVVGGQFTSAGGGQTQLNMARLSPDGVPTWLVDQPASLNAPCVRPGPFSLVVNPALGYSGLTYQWRKNGVAMTDTSPRVVGSSTAALTIADPLSTDAGSYTCAVSTSCGTATTTAATVSVLRRAGDTNGDGVVNFTDLNTVLSGFSQTVSPGTSGDMNGDGVVNFLDLNIVLSTYGTSC